MQWAPPNGRATRWRNEVGLEDRSDAARKRSDLAGGRFVTGALSEKASQGLQTFYPGYPALVMATGIVSNAFHFIGQATLSDFLFIVNLIALPALIVIFAVRAMRYRQELLKDMFDPRLVFSFFTLVAAFDVFGVQLDLRGYWVAATLLWFAALAIWLLLLYFSFAVLTFLNTAQDANVVHGGWLIAIVGTQSLVLLGVRVADHLPSAAPEIIVLIHMLWGIGLVLYAIFITLFSYRIFFFKLSPEDLSPLLWVVMGAAAISANAGTSLIFNRPQTGFLASTEPFIEGATMMVWAWGTWWIPLLVLFGVWKHLVCRVPLAYSPTLWSLVFPLGMYSVATYRFSLATQFPFLQSVGRYFAWIAAVAWIGTMAGLILSSASYFKTAAKTA
ncbi:MAG: tellurite resistance/C4-dicarboxylate transporter family protein [Proteobacteria bacterium]|nr:tellurite resistance/C4-dicarboxylate transporter family protein [Pseudomonadota bacterium]